jgi:uncharacterized membrane protein YeaQ/YmgE (transglycosylase-associated protein family)
LRSILDATRVTRPGTAFVSPRSRLRQKVEQRRGAASPEAAGNRLSVASGAAEENIVHIIGWIVFGLVVGLVAKFLMPGRDPGGFVVTAILGIVGALVGGFVGRLIGLYGEGDPVGFIMAVVGSIILLAIYRFAFVRTARA